MKGLVKCMKISDFLDENRIILDLKAKTKEELLNEMGKTFKDSVYSMAKASAKKTKTPRRAKLQPYDRKTFKGISYE